MAGNLRNRCTFLLFVLHRCRLLRYLCSCQTLLLISKPMICVALISNSQQRTEIKMRTATKSFMYSCSVWITQTRGFDCFFLVLQWCNYWIRIWCFSLLLYERFQAGFRFRCIIVNILVIMMTDTDIWCWERRAARWCIAGRIQTQQLFFHECLIVYDLLQHISNCMNRWAGRWWWSGRLICVSKSFGESFLSQE